MPLQIPKLQPGLLSSLPYEVQDWIRQLTNITPVETITVATSGGVSGTSSGGNAPTLTITLGNITPTSVNTGALTATSVASPAINFGQDPLNYYDEGTWVPVDASGAGVGFTAPTGTYTRIGRLVTARATIPYSVNASGAAAVVGGLPFAALNVSTGIAIANIGAGNIQCVQTNAGAATVNVLISTAGVATNIVLSGATLWFTISYEV